MKWLIRTSGLLVAALGAVGLAYGWTAAGWPQTAEDWVSCVMVHVGAAAFVMVGMLIWLEADA